jgi:Na+/H+-translocating membrane pyrophosphatase
MNLQSMSFDHGILHLANWLGNVMMPTLAAAFIIIAILQFSRGQDFAHAMYGALASLMVSGLTRAFETFASQAAWNNPDLYWLSVLTLINWFANVILPVYAGAQVAAMALRMGVFSPMHTTSGWLRHLVSAALCLMISGLLRLAEFFVAQGSAGIR